MFDSPHTVQITFRPLADVPETDLNALATHLTSGIDSAKVSHFGGQPAVTVFLRVYCFKPSANVVAADRLKQRLGGMSIVVLRNRLVPLREPEDIEIIRFTQGLKPSRWPALRRAGSDLGLLDVRHMVLRRAGRSEDEAPEYLAIDDDVDLPLASTRGLGIRRSGGTGHNALPTWRVWVTVMLVIAMWPLPAVAVAGWSNDWPIGVRSCLLLACGLAGVLTWRLVFRDVERHWLVSLLGTAIWVGSSGIIGWALAHAPNWPGWVVLPWTALVLIVYVSAEVLLRERKDLLRPALLASVLAPSVTFGSVLWGWVTTDGLGIPGEALG